MQINFGLTRPPPPGLHAVHVVGAEARAKDGAESIKTTNKRLQPWEALGVLLNYVFTGGTRDEDSDLAFNLRKIDDVVRHGNTLVVTLAVSIMGNRGFFLHTVNFGKDWFALIALVVFWINSGILLAGQIYGRLRAVSDTVPLEDKQKWWSPYTLPYIVLNYEPFGLEAGIGYWRAMVVLVVFFMGPTLAWDLALYAIAAEMTNYGFYRTLHVVLLIFFLVQQALTACAISVRYGQMRPRAAKPGSDLNAIEQTRMTINSVYTMATLTLTLPVGLAFVFYGLY